MRKRDNYKQGSKYCLSGANKGYVEKWSREGNKSVEAQRTLLGDYGSIFSEFK